jgi:hypothetical protein
MNTSSGCGHEGRLVTPRASCSNRDFTIESVLVHLLVYANLFLGVVEANSWTTLTLAPVTSASRSPFSNTPGPVPDAMRAGPRKGVVFEDGADDESEVHGLRSAAFALVLVQWSGVFPLPCGVTVGFIAWPSIRTTILIWGTAPSITPGG